MLHAPSTLFVVISLILAVLALLASLGVKLPGNNDHAVYVALVAYAVLFLGMLL